MLSLQNYISKPFLKLGYIMKYQGDIKVFCELLKSDQDIQESQAEH